MFLSELLEDYKESDEQRAILQAFVDRVWKSKCSSKKYERYYSFQICSASLDNREDLIQLFTSYNRISYTVFKSYYTQKIEPVDQIRIHLNNVYAFLCDPEVYYPKEYYSLLLTPKREYFKTVSQIKNGEKVEAPPIQAAIAQALEQAMNIRKQSIENKANLSWSEYKKIINSYIERIFSNYIPVEDYEKKHGWELRAPVDWWSEDHYAIKYMCTCITGYMRNYVRDRKPKAVKEKLCSLCKESFFYKSSKRLYCDSCKKQKQLLWQKNSMKKSRKK
ncbi:hypothetical protein [Paenibacillus lutrae]|uniref:Uncharacterized protein n=1 Tax=Paenibacillus lutrae TaxID=2078573 RepID=A0A7X3FJD1_9BACL|nr:hypothetical protein [Paenibacillus lutrae]MVP00808.1 hypothetical protein [Paenibacillus lutrae]